SWRRRAWSCATSGATRAATSVSSSPSAEAVPGASRVLSLSGALRGALGPSAWVVRFASMVPEGAPVLDLACGGGRHTRLFAEAGHPVTAVDVNLSNLGDLAGHPRVEPIQADLEGGDPFFLRGPLPGRTF